MASITVKNLPDDLHQRLKDRAARHHRSLNSELIACLTSVIMVESIDPDALLVRANEIRQTVGGRLTDDLLLRLKSEGRP